MARIELATSSLPRKRSTPELHWRSLSGRRGSNPRPSAWKADALPTELLPQIFFENLRVFRLRLGNVNQFPLHSTCTKTPLFKVKARSVFCRALVGEDGFEPPKVKTSRFTVCPIWPLWYSPKIHLRTFEPMEGIEPTTPRLQITCSGQLSYIGNAFCFPSGRFVSQRDCKGRHYFLICKSFQSFF